MNVKRLFFLLFALILGLVIGGKSPMMAQTLDKQTGRLIIDTTMRVVTAKPTYHQVGVRYNIANCGVSFSPDLKAKTITTYNNIALLYTYYSPLWGYMDYFGFQTGIKYGSYGFTTEYNINNMDQTLTYVELPLLAAFHYDFNKFRIYLNVGPFLDYHLATSRSTGFDCYDQRTGYGILGYAGLGYQLGRFQIGLDFGYQYSLGFMFHPEKLADDWWLYSYASQWSFGLSLHYTLNH
ncbi:MAG: PorT family protein [Bacteroidales bacterium]|nr:PorT family protein [Bacteroidales bacterium]